MRQILCCLFCLIPPVCLGQGFTINTVAGNGVQGFSGDNGLATSAQIAATAGITVDNAGNLYIADNGNNRIRKVTPNGTITTVAGAAPGYSGDGGPATKASLYQPRGVAVDTAGNLYIADTGNYAIRKVDTHGIITTIAGTGVNGFSGDSGPAAKAQVSDVNGIAFDTAGNLYFADRTNQRIRKIALDGTISTFAGTGTTGFTGEGGQAINANFYYPRGVAFDTPGNLYVTETVNHSVRKISPSGIVTTVIGKGFGQFGFSGDGGLAINALLYDPQGAVVDASGNIYIPDEDNQRIRMISPNGIITTVAGDGVKNFSGDGGPALNAEMALPAGIAVGPTGAVYFVDAANNRVRVLIPASYGQPPAITNGGVVTASAFGEFSTIAPGAWIEIYGTNLALGTNTWGAANFTGNTAPASLNGTSVTIGDVYAFVQYADPTHINVQVPSGIATGSQKLVVVAPAGASVPYNVTVNATSAGLLAPSSFVIGGSKYVAALFSDGTTFVLPPGAIAGVASRRAKVGDVITFYGTGFGAVTPAIPAGQITQQTNALSLNLQLQFEGMPATLTYAGLAPGAVGLYQFNAIVPNVPASDTTLLTFTLGNVSSGQTLLIAVQ